MRRLSAFAAKTCRFLSITILKSRCNRVSRRRSPRFKKSVIVKDDVDPLHLAACACTALREALRDLETHHAVRNYHAAALGHDERGNGRQVAQKGRGQG